MAQKWIISTICLFALTGLCKAQQCPTALNPAEDRDCFIRAGVDYILPTDDDPNVFFSKIQDIFRFEIVRPAQEQFKNCSYTATISNKQAYRACMSTLFDNCLTTLQQLNSLGLLSLIPEAVNSQSTVENAAMTRALASKASGEDLLDTFEQYECHPGCVNNAEKFARIDNCVTSGSVKGLAAITSCGANWDCAKADIVTCPLIYDLVVTRTPALAACDTTIDVEATTQSGGDGNTGDGGDGNTGDGGDGNTGDGGDGNTGDGGDGNTGDGGDGNTGDGGDGGTGGTTDTGLSCDTNELVTRMQCIGNVYARIFTVSIAQNTGNVFIDNPGAALCSIMDEVLNQKDDYLNCYQLLITRCFKNVETMTYAAVDAMQVDPTIKAILKNMYKNLLSVKTMELLLNLERDIYCNDVCVNFVAPVDQLTNCIGVNSEDAIPQLLLSGLSTGGLCRTSVNMMTCLTTFLQGCRYYNDLFMAIFSLQPQLVFGTISQFIPQCQEDLPFIEGCDVQKHARCLLQTFPTTFEMVNPLNATNVILLNSDAFCTVREQFKIVQMQNCLEEMVQDCIDTNFNPTGLTGPMTAIAPANPVAVMRVIPGIVQTLFDEMCTSVCQPILRGQFQDPTSCYVEALEGLGEFRTGENYVDGVCRQLDRLYGCNMAGFGDCKLVSTMMDILSVQTGVPLQTNEAIPNCRELLKSGFGTCDLVKLTECSQKTVPRNALNIANGAQLIDSMTSQREAFCRVKKDWNVGDLTLCYEEYFASCGLDIASQNLQNFMGSGAAFTGQQAQVTLRTVSRAINLVFDQACDDACTALFTGQKPFDPTSCLLNVVLSGSFIDRIIQLGSQDFQGLPFICDDVLKCMTGGFGECRLLRDITSLASGVPNTEPSCSLILQQLDQGGLVPTNLIPKNTCDQKILRSCVAGVAKVANLPIVENPEDWSLEELLTWSPQQDICEMDLVGIKTCFQSYMNSCGVPALTSIQTNTMFEKALLDILYDSTGAYWKTMQCTFCRPECLNFDQRFQALQQCFIKYDLDTTVRSIADIGINVFDSKTPQLEPYCNVVGQAVDCLTEAVGDCGAMIPILRKIMSTSIPSGLLWLQTSYCHDLNMPFITDSPCSNIGAAECNPQDFQPCEQMLTDFHNLLPDQNVPSDVKCSKGQEYATCSAQTTTNFCESTGTQAGMIELQKAKIEGKLAAVGLGCAWDWVAKTTTSGASIGNISGFFLLVATLLAVIRLL